MRHATLWLAPLTALAIGLAQPALAAPTTSAGPVLFDPAGLKAMAADAARYPLFAEEVARTRKMVDAAIKAGIDVPVPKDPGGGFTHEQHKRNYMALYGAGMLYRITGDVKYAHFARDMLLQYAKLYPTLGPHPAANRLLLEGRTLRPPRPRSGSRSGRAVRGRPPFRPRRLFPPARTIPRRRGR